MPYAASNAAPANLVRDFYRLLRILGVHRWDSGNDGQSLRLGTLARFSQLLADFEHTRRRARWTEKDGESVYLGGQSRGPYLYLTLFNYLQYYAKEAYEDYELRFRVEKDYGFHLLESPLSEDQQVREGQKHYEITATVVDSAMLDWWLRGFGKAVSRISKTKIGGR